MVTFKQFRTLMARRKRSVDDLVYRFRGKIDDPRGFLERVWQGRYDNVVIPYRSVLRFYAEELRGQRNLGKKNRDFVGEFSGVFTPPLSMPQLEAK